MKKQIKKYAALTALSLAATLNDVGNSFTGIPIYNSYDYKSYGYNKKKCKSCINFNHCKDALNKRPFDNACGEYIKKKK